MQGIGYAVAQRFASEGAQHVGLLDMPGERLTAAGVSFEQEFGRKAILLPCNVTKEEEVAAAFKQLIEAAGRCDVLVQAAGIVGQTNLRSHEVNTDNFQLVMDINVKGITREAEGEREGEGNFLGQSGLTAERVSASILLKSRMIPRVSIFSASRIPSLRSGSISFCRGSALL